MRRGLQALLEAEVSALTGAQLHERCPDQRSPPHRNGYRERVLTTQVATSKCPETAEKWVTEDGEPRPRPR